MTFAPLPHFVCRRCQLTVDVEQLFLVQPHPLMPDKVGKAQLTALICVHQLMINVERLLSLRPGPLQVFPWPRSGVPEYLTLTERIKRCFWWQFVPLPLELPPEPIAAADFTSSSHHGLLFGCFSAPRQTEQPRNLLVVKHLIMIEESSIKRLIPVLLILVFFAFSF